MSKIFLVVNLLILPVCLYKIYGQTISKINYTDANTLTVLGRTATADSGSYRRISTLQREKLTPAVSRLATNSAGISIVFQTNSKSIRLKWSLEKLNQLANMTPIAVNGLDLYGWNGKEWQYIAAAKPSALSNEQELVKNLRGDMTHYRLFAPLYAELKELMIGVDSGAVIQPAGRSFIPERKIVIYGSSITQGASASRPGMAYPAILSRKLNAETFNMGFSGNGKMEIEMADVLAEMPADVYILDCVPNPSPAQIRERAVPFIKRLRSLKPDIPILMVESIFREDAHWDTVKYLHVTDQNKAFSEAYRLLRAADFKKLYYLASSNLTGHDHEATIDGTHLTDLGFVRLSEQMMNALGKIRK